MNEREIGTCLWFATKNESYGYILRSDGESQIFCHYKQILADNQRNPSHRELFKDDVVSFVEGEGYYTNGSQAMEVKIEIQANDND